MMNRHFAGLHEQARAGKAQSAGNPKAAIAFA
jgi:hypothetical protein